jgi:WD40 repeat protein/DNA-binding SARP family transcriptional activator
MARLSLSLLGPFRATLDGQPLTGFRSDKGRALLAYLAVESDHAHRRESLSGMLWPERPERSARHSLSQALSNLRQIVDDDRTAPSHLAITHQALQLDPASDCCLDVTAFTDSIAACQRHAHAQRASCDLCLGRLERTVALYQGEFLEGFTLGDAPAFEEWATLQREHLHRLAIEALHDLAMAHEHRGAFDRGVQAARRAVALDPLSESAHRQLMRLLALAGKRGAAIAQYEACCRVLANELGVEAEQETRALYARIRDGALVAPAGAEEGRQHERRTVGPCPYRGLSAFGEADAPFFHGREAFAARLVEAVHARPLVVVVVGPSGSGKSSVVYAGLLPRLRQEGGWQIVDLRPRGEPYRALAGALLPVLEPDLGETDRLIQAGKLADALQGGEVRLLEVVDRVLAKLEGRDRLLLLIDQFEELYTLCPQAEMRRRFLVTLLAAVEAAGARRPCPLALLLTLRADFMGQALAHRPFADLLQDAALMLGPMTRQELRAAIVEPAEQQGAALEPGLVERLLDDVGQEPGHLPLLEFALTLLWERLDGGWMTHAAYDEIGRVEGALARYAEQVYQELGEEEREGARWVLEQLVQPGEGTEDTRRVATRAEVGGGQWPLVQQLADRRLVVTGRDATAGTETVEVAHEALIQRWGRLRGWMEEDRAFRTWQEGLRVALRVWEGSERDEGALLRGAPLAQAERWLAERGHALTAAEVAYIRAGAALRQRQQAEQARRRKETLRQVSIGLAGQAKAELEGASPERAVLLALEALQHYPYTGQAESALAQAVHAFKPYHVVHEYEMRAHHAIWSPDGGCIVISGMEGMIRIYDAESGAKRLHFNERDMSDIWSLAWSADDRLVTVSRGLGAARVWDVETGTLLRTYRGHEGPVHHVALSADGALALTAGADGTARVWEVASGAERLVLGGDGAAMQDAAWSPGGDRILTASGDGVIRMWDVSKALEAGGGKAEELLSVAAHATGALAVCWSPDGGRFASGGVDGLARVWDAGAGQALLTLMGHGDQVRDVSWAPEGRRIATASGDGTARVWDARAGDELYTLYGLTGDLWTVEWSPGGERLVSGGGVTSWIWDLPPPALRLVGHTDRDGLICAHWSPDGSLIATAARGGVLRVWDARSGEQVQVFTGHLTEDSRLQRAWYFAWSPAGDRIASTGSDNMVRVWDARSGEELLAYAEHTGAETWSAEWSPDGTRIVSAGSDGCSHVWNAQTGERMTTYCNGCLVHATSWSPDGTRIASGCVFGSLEGATVWDAATGEPLTRFDKHADSIGKPDWSPDGARIATPSWDRTVRIWDAETGEELLVFTGHADNLHRARWSPDGRRIVSCDESGMVRIWDAETGIEVYHFRVPGAAYSCEWSPDGRQVIVAGSFPVPEIRRVWPSTESLVAYAQEHCVLRELTAEERAQFGLPPRESIPTNGWVAAHSDKGGKPVQTV